MPPLVCGKNVEAGRKAEANTLDERVREGGARQVDAVIQADEPTDLGLRCKETIGGIVQ